RSTLFPYTTLFRSSPRSEVRSPKSEVRLRTPLHGLWTADVGLRAAGFGLRTSDRGLLLSHLTLRPRNKSANIGMVHGDDNQCAARRAKNNWQRLGCHQIDQ